MDAAGTAAAQDQRDSASSIADPRSLERGLGIFAVHLLLYLATLVGAVSSFPLPVNILFAVANGVFIALLFIVGHDGNHGSLVPQRAWNLWLARFAFIPCAHSASLWRQTHNEHHRRTNLKGVDRVWAPMSKAEYDAASPLRRAIERLYRGPFGPLFYYYGEFWPHRMLLPLSPETRTEWKRHVPDCLFALTGLAVTLLAIGTMGAALAPARPLWLTLVTGWAIPFAVWNYIFAVTIYLNHTHPSIPWFRDENGWSFHRGNVLSTVHMTMPRYLLPLYSDVLAHTAHHTDISLPVYALVPAQAKLKSTFGADVQEYPLSIVEYRKTYTACKLFDFDRMCWTDFDGVATAATWAADLETPAIG
ncbi:MAG TPA: fatty acid desaturase [Rhizomicrobium sp.]|jgi:omega-6 fatty acid desaturase (delta-12 desaturase)|nr:fatty acid desaturase [Rhizomicrobium sp.]